MTASPRSNPSSRSARSTRPTPSRSRGALRRLLALALGALIWAVAGPAGAGESAPDPAEASRADAATIQVYKTPTCGCCNAWIDHLRAAGFRVESTDLPDLAALKAMNGVPARLASCHTALVEGYVIEGHVPASDVARLLAERPEVSGLAVPGMPLGSPGMEHPDPSRHEAYDVLSFGPEGVGRFASHEP